MTHPVLDRYRRNWQGFWQEHRWFYYLFTIAIFCDALSTMYFMHLDGADAELHPLYRIAAYTFGYTVGPLLGFLSKLIGGLIVGVYFRRWAVVIFLAVAAISFWAGWYNVWGRETDFSLDSLLALAPK